MTEKFPVKSTGNFSVTVNFFGDRLLTPIVIDSKLDDVYSVPKSLAAPRNADVRVSAAAFAIPSMWWSLVAGPPPAASR